MQTGLLTGQEQSIQKDLKISELNRKLEKLHEEARKVIELTDELDISKIQLEKLRRVEKDHEGLKKRMVDVNCMETELEQLKQTNRELMIQAEKLEQTASETTLLRSQMKFAESKASVAIEESHQLRRELDETNEQLKRLRQRQRKLTTESVVLGSMAAATSGGLGLGGSNHAEQSSPGSSANSIDDKESSTMTAASLPLDRELSATLGHSIDDITSPAL